MDLISREAVNEAIEDEWDGCCGEYPAIQIINETQSAVDRITSVPAVPLDKLCEWLARNAFAFKCEDCEEYCRALLDCEHEVGSDQEYWKNKLTKWMEEQNV